MKIAVLMCGLVFDCQKKIISGIKEAAKEKGCHVFVFTCMGDVFITNEYSNGEFSIFSLPDFNTFDGVILAGNTIMHKKTIDNLINKIQASKIPAISIDNKIEGFANIFSDNKQAMKNMVDHLIYHHNYKRIVFLAGPKANIESQQRLEGYLESMAEANISISPKWYQYHDFTDRSGETAVSNFLEAFDYLPQAIVCANDLMAISTVNALAKRNIKTPDQIAVTGFDYTADAIFYSPQIASVKRFQEETGYKALEHLYDVISSNKKNEVDIEIKTAIISSTSCGCPEHSKPEDTVLRKALIAHKDKTSHESMMLKNLYTKAILLNNHKDFYDSLKTHYSNDFLNQFYLCMKCLKDKKDEYTYTFSKESVLNVAFHKELDFSKYKNTVFPTEKILPDFLLDDHNPMFYFVMPIHAIEYTIGYAVIDSNAPLNSELFYTSILNIGLLHENIKNKIRLKTTVEQLDELWIHDSLTGLYNRNGFMKHTKEIMKEHIYQDTMLLVLFMDIDNLKLVNDNFGHFEGDQYLQAMTQVIINSKTRIKLAMRYGGDEFVIFVPNQTEESAKEYIDSIISDIELINYTEQKPYPMDMSIGYVLKKIDQFDKPETLIKQADIEMYIVKNNKKSK